MWLLLAIMPAFADDQNAGISATQTAQQHQAQVMETFERQQDAAEKARDLNDHQKHRIMFFIGIPLLIFLLVTGGLGIAAGIYGKQVFVWHMLFAGLSVTLAIVHVIVGLVWFYPF